MIQDTLNPTTLSLTTQQILVTIWTIGTVILIPIGVALIKILHMLYKSNERLIALVVGIHDENGDVLKVGLIGEIKGHERRVATIEHTLNGWLVIWRNGVIDTPEEFIKRVAELEWISPPRFKE